VVQPITTETPRPTTVVGLLQPQRVGAALRLGPGGIRPACGWRRPSVRDGLERAVLRVRAAGLERHHERLAGGVLDGVGELEAARVDPLEDLGGDPGTAERAGGAPGGRRGTGGRDQRERVGLGVAHGELDAVRRALGRDRAGRAGHVDREGLAEEGGERALTRGRRVLTVDGLARRLRKADQ
jgi:hypothetical protein